MYCKNCGAPIADDAAFCTQCGTAVAAEPNGPAVQRKSKMAAGLLGVFLGGFGVHNFYLGYTGKGVAQIILNFVCGVGAIWGFIEGILILAGNINCDANGVPLGE